MKKLFTILAMVLMVLMAVPAMAATTATAELSWNAPTTNTDGTPLTDLAGYKVYMSTSATGTYTLIGTATTTGYIDTVTVPNNTKIVRYYVVTAIDTSGNESVY